MRAAKAGFPRIEQRTEEQNSKKGWRFTHLSDQTDTDPPVLTNRALQFPLSNKEAARIPKVQPMFSWGTVARRGRQGTSFRSDKSELESGVGPVTFGKLFNLSALGFLLRLIIPLPRVVIKTK